VVVSPLVGVKEYAHPDHGTLGSDERPRKVLMSPDLMVQMAEAASGRRVTVLWGQPNADGFYTPTIYVSDDDGSDRETDPTTTED
jgi:hypothetical protein